MFNVTAKELSEAMALLPEPSGTFDPTLSVSLINPDRILTFHKVTRGDGRAEPWHNEWSLLHNPAPLPPALSNEEFDSVTDAMQDAEQQILLNVAQTLLDDMEANTMRTVANWCDERAETLEAEADDTLAAAEVGDGPVVTDEVSDWIKPMFEELFRSPDALPLPMPTFSHYVEAEADEDQIEAKAHSLFPSHAGFEHERGGRPGGRTYDADYTPSLEELQEAADARGEPGPLDKCGLPETEVGGVKFTEAEKDQAAAEIEKVSKLLDDMAEFFFEPNEYQAVIDRMDEVGVDLYSSVRAAILEEIDWTEWDLPDGGYAGRDQKVRERMAAETKKESAALDGFKEVPEEAEDFDLFAAAKAIRKASLDYNAVVTKARLEGNVVVNAYAKDGDGTIWIDTIKLEMKL